MRDEPNQTSSDGKRRSLESLAEEVKAPAAGRSLLRAAGLVSGLTLLSRLLGLVREQVFAALLGAGREADAFQIAFRIPNLLRDLFAEGALSAAFVPTYAAALLRGRVEAQRLASRVFSVLAVIVTGIVLLGFLGAGEIVAALAPGYGQIPGKTDLTVLLTRVMLPFLLLVVLAAVAMGMLNAAERFAAPALAPAIFNVVAIVVGIGLWLAKRPPEQAVLGWAVATLLGGLAQFLIQAPSLRALGYRFSWDWAPTDPGIRRIAALMAPATIGLAAVQLNIFISSRFASDEPGAVSWLSYAFRILYLPIGIFGVALGTLATVGLAKSAASGDLAGLRATLLRSIRLLLFLSIPSTAGLLALGVPVVRLLYERGRFSAADTASTAAAVSFYAVGLVAYTGVKILAPAFYALGTPRVPLLGSVLAIATNLIVITCLDGTLGYRAVALGTSLGSLANAACLGFVLQRRIGGLGGASLWLDVCRMTLAALAMAVAAWAAARGLESIFGTAGVVAQLVTALVPVVTGVIAYAGAARLLRIRELDEMLQAASRKA